ncbi:hypothetical protein LXL04_038756 [Taraxacum kok-saghyz]
MFLIENDFERRMREIIRLLNHCLRMVHEEMNLGKFHKKKMKNTRPYLTSMKKKKKKKKKKGELFLEQRVVKKGEQGPNVSMNALRPPVVTEVKFVVVTMKLRWSDQEMFSVRPVDLKRHHQPLVSEYRDRFENPWIYIDSIRLVAILMFDCYLDKIGKASLDITFEHGPLTVGSDLKQIFNILSKGFLLFGYIWK